MNTSEHYAEIALKAATRAADKVKEEAYLYNKSIPVWEGKNVVYKVPPAPKKSELEGQTRR